MEWLKELRSSKNFTQAEVARLSGITRSAYTNFEIGRRKPSVNVAKRIANTLGFDWTKFYDKGGENNRNIAASDH